MSQSNGTQQDKKEMTPQEHTFRIKQIMLERLRVEFPLHDVADLGMVVQRMWQDIERDELAKEKRRVIV